jgi:CRP-like cAMP-binding protein
MEQLKRALNQMINISETELSSFLKDCYQQSFKKKEALSIPGKIPNEVFFLNKGIIRVMIIDNIGTEHTIHFAIENQFIADYAGFIQNKSSIYTLQAIEETDAIVMPRSAIEWGYENLKEGEKLGRLVSEFYFIYHDNRIKNMYARTPKERYDNITDVFPNIHNRVPQHMIASYLGITSVHLSRLKKAALKKT